MSSASNWLHCALHQTSSSSSSHATNCEPYRMLEAKSSPRSSRWLCHDRSGGKAPRFTLRLEEKSLVSYLEIDNGGVSEIDVWVGNEEGSHNMVKLKSAVRLACNRLNEVKIGHIPCRFLEIRCTRGSPFSIYQIRLSGISASSVGAVMGSSTEHLLYRATENLLYGKSLRLTRPLAKPRAAKMAKVGGDLTDKSYSYLTNLTTPCSIEMSGDGLPVYGVNLHQKKLDDALLHLSMIAKEGGGVLPHSPDVYDNYAILPKGVGGVGKKRGSPPIMGVPSDEVRMVQPRAMVF